MKIKAVLLIIILSLLLASQISQGEVNALRLHLNQGFSIQRADSLYSIQEYDAALAEYERIKWSRTDPAHLFRMAYAEYQTEQYQNSANHFLSLLEKYEFLDEFSFYFHIKSLWQYNPALAVYKSTKYIEKYKGHALSDSLTVPVAEAMFEQGNYKDARKFFQLAKKQKIKPGKNAYFLIQAAHAHYIRGYRTAAKKEYYQIIRKYPSAKKTHELVKWLGDNEPEFYKKYFFDVCNVYLKNRHYTDLRNILEQYIKRETNGLKKEKARFTLLKTYYDQGRYKTALYGLKTLLKDHKQKNIEPYIRLYIARIYLRLGQKTQAAKAYIDYAHRFPKRRIAPEAIWKAAWIYEELRKPEQSQKLYRELRKRWSRSKFAKEAHFREGFTSYRLGRYEEADAVFSDIRFKRWPDLHKNRAQYWSSLCREIKGDTITAKRLRSGLAESLWDDYYTMKSYLLDKDELDESLNISKQFENSPNTLSFYATGFANLLNQFEDAFLVRELLGHYYGLIALSDIKLKAKSREEWIALAEIYKKFGDYGKAYRTYDYINRKFYNHQSFVQKPFILKERFPFYYDHPIEKYGQRYGLDKELILGLIKQESTYRANVVSWADAWGLMQLIPSTAKEMAQIARVKLTENEQLFDPDFNIHLGSLYLKILHRRFNGKKEWMLAAYNAGPHRVNRWKKIPGSDQIDVFIENIEFSETRNYVRKVMKNYWAYTLLSNNFNVEQHELILGMK